MSIDDRQSQASHRRGRRDDSLGGESDDDGILSRDVDVHDLCACLSMPS